MIPKEPIILSVAATVSVTIIAPYCPNEKKLLLFTLFTFATTVVGVVVVVVGGGSGASVVVVIAVVVVVVVVVASPPLLIIFEKNKYGIEKTLPFFVKISIAAFCSI